MIARLVGKLAETSADSAIVDVQGVGYLVQASARTLDALGPVGGDITILTELQVREDGWTLFGFGSTGEREAFRQADQRPGRRRPGRAGDPLRARSRRTGGRRQHGDKAMVARANGVGPKLAQRIVNELAGKLGSPALAGTIGAAPPRGGAAADALSALANLGFKPAEASAAVAAANEELGADANLDALVRLALKEGGEMTSARRPPAAAGSSRLPSPAIRCGFRSATASTARSGREAPFAVQARWPEADGHRGPVGKLCKVTDSGNHATHHFCPECGSDVHYRIDGKFDGLVAIPLVRSTTPFPRHPNSRSGKSASTTGSRDLGDESSTALNSACRQSAETVFGIPARRLLTRSPELPALRHQKSCAFTCLPPHASL